MTSLELSSYIAMTVGGLQLCANALALQRGVTRLPQELAREGATARVADLLSTAWIYGTVANVCISVLLLFIAGSLRAGDRTAWAAAAAIGLYYVLVGLMTYGLAPRKHLGLLAFTLFGVAVLAPLLWSRLTGR